jgi:hypothetical protein
MSLLVFAIAAAHATPPVIGAMVGKSKVAVYVGAAIGGLLAIASGNPVYTVADLAGVAFGLWIGLAMKNEATEKSDI